MIHAGIDAGSRAIKIVLYDADRGEVIASGCTDQGVAQNERSEKLFSELCTGAGVERGDIRNVTATGYGRKILRFATNVVTEITCHARGVRHIVPDAGTIIEIGGQDSKAIRINRNGRVQDFTMNDRCAAGTGRFLEVIATRLEMELDTFGEEAVLSREPALISSMCVVFAETEIIGLLASGTAPKDIAAGVQVSVARRVASMAGRSVTSPIVFTGGVAMIPGMAGALEEAIGRPLVVPESPQFTGALGAALIATES